MPTAVALPTQAEIEAKTLADKQASLAAAQEKYEAPMKPVALALPESKIRRNDAAVGAITEWPQWRYWPVQVSCWALSGGKHIVREEDGQYDLLLFWVKD